MPKVVTQFGTCRIIVEACEENKKTNKIISSYLNEELSHTTSTKEIIQLINYINTGEMPYPMTRYCFRRPILCCRKDRNLNHKNRITKKKCLDTYLKYEKIYKKVFESTDIFILEILTKKVHMIGNYYLFYLTTQFDKQKPGYRIETEAMINDHKELVNKINVRYQTLNEIEEDLNKIISMLPSKKIVIVSHTDLSKSSNSNIYKGRTELIKFLDKYCINNKILFYNPTELLKNYSEEKLWNFEKGEVTLFGQGLIRDNVFKIIDKNYL